MHVSIHIHIQNYDDDRFGEMLLRKGCRLWTVSNIISALGNNSHMEHHRLGVCGVSFFPTLGGIAEELMARSSMSRLSLSLSCKRPPRLQARQYKKIRSIWTTDIMVTRFESDEEAFNKQPSRRVSNVLIWHTVSFCITGLKLVLHEGRIRKMIPLRKSSNAHEHICMLL